MRAARYSYRVSHLLFSFAGLSVVSLLFLTVFRCFFAAAGFKRPEFLRLSEVRSLYFSGFISGISERSGSVEQFARCKAWEMPTWRRTIGVRNRSAKLHLSSSRHGIRIPNCDQIRAHPDLMPYGCAKPSAEPASPRGATRPARAPPHPQQMTGAAILRVRVTDDPIIADHSPAPRGSLAHYSR